MDAAELDDVLDELLEPVCDLCDYADGEGAGLADMPEEIAALFAAARRVRDRYGFEVERSR